LRGALDILSKKHKISWFLDKTLPDPEDKYDFYLIWDDSNSDAIDKLPQKSHKGLCLTTDPVNFENLRKLDVVFCESVPVYDKVRREGIRAIKAFGTDTDYFSPQEGEKNIPYFYPATFSPWKRQSELAYLGNKLYLVGTMQPDGFDEYESCRKNGVNIEIGYFPVKKIRDMYRRTKNIIIPAIHGSERTVLESMSMNILPEVTHTENTRTCSYINEFKRSNCVNPREFVIKHYSSWIYAADLERGMA
jgi:hypothetical protein